MENLKLLDNIRLLSSGKHPLIGCRQLHKPLTDAIARHDLDQAHQLILKDPCFVAFVLENCHQSYPTVKLKSLKQALETIGFAGIGRYAGLFYLPESKVNFTPQTLSLSEHYRQLLEKMLTQVAQQFTKFPQITQAEREEAYTLVSLGLLPELLILQAFAQTNQHLNNPLPVSACEHISTQHRFKIGTALAQRFGFSLMMQRQFALAHQLEIPAHNLEQLPIEELKTHEGNYSSGLIARSVLMLNGLSLNTKGSTAHHIWQRVA